MAEGGETSEGRAEGIGDGGVGDDNPARVSEVSEGDGSVGNGVALGSGEGDGDKGVNPVAESECTLTGAAVLGGFLGVNPVELAADAGDEAGEADTEDLS